MKDKLPTAKEFLRSKGLADPKYIVIAGNNVIEYMKEYAKLHVKEALKQASEKAGMIWATTDFYDDRKIIHKPSILNAYPLDNIK